MLASRFASHSPALRSDYPLSDDQIRRVAPSIFADAPHESRSERYSYIPNGQATRWSFGNWIGSGATCAI
ncbi:hypothetical protein [Burkholderia cenocepacia]|uniref:hypothetical protein n=1 Tax=Burkholderia cenocepacia TaxID=95486 RepID=UPI001A4D8197|nr:Uncharacterised protein [Xylophilus ampelinus]